MTSRKCDLVRATLQDLPAMQAMASFYVYDISEYVGGEKGWEFPETGRYECEDLRPYFEDADANPYFIRVAGELAGFAIVDGKGSDERVQRNMAQFFVLRKFKGRGIGEAAAAWCFRAHTGAWEVNVIPANRGAFCFWSRIIPRCAAGAVELARRPAPHLRNAIKDIFRFETT